MHPTVGIGLLGCGTVGGGVAELLLRQRARIQDRSGVRYVLRAIAVRSLCKERSPAIPRELYTLDAHAILDDPEIDLVVECVGGTEHAIEFIERALEHRKHVVTANKDAIATQGPRLAALAAGRGVGLAFEAAVGGAIPIVRALDAALAGDEVVEIAGVLNGTTNFMLGRMATGSSYADALARAQFRGYAEADPRNDVEGIDATHKLAILIQRAFRQAVISPRIRRRGIVGIRPEQIARAASHGYAVKLLAYARKVPNGCLAQVAPVLVPRAHPLAQAIGPENYVRVVGETSGPLAFSGLGAGREPTTSAVAGDIVAALRAVGERHDLGWHERYSAGFTPAIAVSPAFDDLDLLEGYPIWHDLTSHEAPASLALPAHALPG